MPEGLATVLATADELILAQTVLKLALPGIPDSYRGTEVPAFALTDPDNRRPVDFAMLAEGFAVPASLARGIDRRKLALTIPLLRLRRAQPDIFLSGDYVPLPPEAGVSFLHRLGSNGLRIDLRLAARTAPWHEGELLWPATPGEPSPVRITLLSRG